ncbi:MAG TPA: GDP-mannose 4,6-dehydratase, partial [Pyrinomonadaceae bacterium]
VATGETHTVREFCERAFDKVELDYRKYVKTDENFYRPAEVDLLRGDPAKARRVLGWKPVHTFQQLVDEMVESDLASVTRLGDKSPSFADGSAGAGVA